MLLFDENLPPRLARDLGHVFPGSTSVAELGLTGQSDRELATAAIQRGLTVVTKDRDLPNFAALLVEPLKVVWLRTGNCSVADLRSILLAHANLIVSLAASDDYRILALPPGMLG